MVCEANLDAVAGWLPICSASLCNKGMDSMYTKQAVIGACDDKGGGYFFEILTLIRYSDTTNHRSETCFYQRSTQNPCLWNLYEQRSTAAGVGLKC